jgi:hypothetical protein
MGWRDVLGVARSIPDPHPQYSHNSQKSDGWGISANIANSISIDDDYEERAAIIEHDGGIPREWAEGFARLDPARPPAGLTLQRWHTVIEAIGIFLDKWAGEAVAKGWGRLIFSVSTQFVRKSPG